MEKRISCIGSSRSVRFRPRIGLSEPARRGRPRRGGKPSRLRRTWKSWFSIQSLCLLLAVRAVRRRPGAGRSGSVLGEERGDPAVLVGPAVREGREDEVARVPHVERPPRVDDDLRPRRRRRADRAASASSRAGEAAEEPLVVVQLGDAERQRVLDAVGDAVLRLDRLALPDDEVADAVGWTAARVQPSGSQIGIRWTRYGPGRRVAASRPPR